MRSLMLAVAEPSATNSAYTTGGGIEDMLCIAAVNLRSMRLLCKGVNVAISPTDAALSVSGKEWRIPVDVSVDAGLIAAAGGSQLLAKMLLKRGIRTAREAEVFLNPREFQPSKPEELPDMPKAVARIMTAIEKEEQITVYGDYDVDGVTGTSTLLTVLRRLGAKVDYYIPNRMTEGYGLNLKAVSIIASKRKTKLIITCDCGVSNFAEINFAKSLGVETIVADHHTMPALMPPAVAILHPKLLDESHPLFHLPGVGVAYKLGEALLQASGIEAEAASLLDYVTLGMIADLVPLIRENRYLVQIGLPLLSQSPRPGIQALLAQVQNNGSTDVVGFGLAPRINAVGRLADANQAVELLTTEDEAAAAAIAKQLQLENTRRQELCEKIMLEADYLVATTIDTSKDKAIVICKEGWHHGVVGIVASRLVEKYHVPAFVGGIDAEENIVKGSARGVAGIDLYEVLRANEGLMTRFGGHKMAAGFSLEPDKVEVFSRALTDTCNRMLAEKSLRPVLEVDAVVQPEEVDIPLVNLLSAIAPFGMDNKKPVLVLRDLFCADTRVLGKEGKHTRIMLEDPMTGDVFESVFWNSKDKVPGVGARLDVAFTPEINSYNGRDRLQLVLSDWRSSSGPVADANAVPELIEIPQIDVPSIAVEQAITIETVPAIEPEEPATPMEEPTTVPAISGNDLASVQPDRISAITAVSITWKDLRNHADPLSVLKAAVKNLGDKLTIFAEAVESIDGVVLADRTYAEKRAHLVLWQYPPNAKVLQDLLTSTGAKTVYLIGSAPAPVLDPTSFLRKLLGLVRYVVNQRDGQVSGDKLCAALATDKMSVALGLGVLRKMGVIDWFAEEGIITVDLMDEPTGPPDEFPEYRQLGNQLSGIAAFRNWFAEASLDDIQLGVLPNQVQVRKPQEREVKDESQQSSHRAEVR